ncbi:MAG: MBL fold metallo-hydrolase [Chloroflexi bacterium]|nr:MAG: MBL fold metallo-hydrolase [Chloroflexota bacterium]
MKLVMRQVGPWGMNTYALICEQTGESVLIDPGADPDTLQDMLAGSKPVAILLTHSHSDHVGALDEMLSRLQVPLMGHAGPLGAIGVKFTADHWLDDGDTVQVGTHILHVRHAPGHIGNQICFIIENDHRIIVGDTIFDGGPGKTWSSEEFQVTRKTLKDVVLPWSDESVCYPGHGPHFRLGDRRAEIEAFLAKDHGDFYGDATWDMDVSGEIEITLL